MKTIKFLLMGNKNVGKSTLLDTYLWKLKYGMAYHDHTTEEIRYMIDVIEIETVEELRAHLTEHIEMKNIYFVCFNVNDRKSLHIARNEWILELLQHNPKTRIFLVGLQCDLRDQILMKLKQDCVSHSDGVTISRYYENVQYLECSSNKIESVENLFDKAIKIVLYEDGPDRNEQKIIEFYEQIQISFKFKRCDCETVCEQCLRIKMKEIRFLLIGDTSSDITTLLDTFVWKLHFGYAYHDHILQHRRYHITLHKISSFEEFQQKLISNSTEIICICLLCFNVTQKMSFEMLNNMWFRQIMDLTPNMKAHIFLVALKKDLKKCILTKLFPQNNVKHREVLNVCRFYNGRIKYLECSNFEKENVRKLFDKAICLVLYNK